jgi:hypothetical protein
MFFVLTKSKHPLIARKFSGTVQRLPHPFQLHLAKRAGTNPLDPLFVNPAEIDRRDPRLLFAFDFLCVSVPLW